LNYYRTKEYRIGLAAARERLEAERHTQPPTKY
jgi:hypothetical protein